MSDLGIKSSSRVRNCASILQKLPKSEHLSSPNHEWSFEFSTQCEEQFQKFNPLELRQYKNDSALMKNQLVSGNKKTGKINRTLSVDIEDQLFDITCQKELKCWLKNGRFPICRYILSLRDFLWPNQPFFAIFLKYFQKSGHFGYCAWIVQAI